MQVSTPPPVEALTSVPTDRLKELYVEFDQLQRQLEHEPGGLLTQSDGETVLVFFTLASATIEKLCIQLMLGEYPDEEYPQHVGSRTHYLATEVPQGKRIEFLHDRLDEFDNATKGLVVDVWKSRCVLVHDAHAYRRPPFDLKQKGKKALDTIKELQRF